MKKTISFDLDDTLFDVVELFIKYSNKNWKTNLDFKNLQDSDRIFQGLTDEQENALWVKFLENKETMEIKPKPAVKAAVDALSKKYRLITISARDPILQPSGRAWIKKHFPGKFDKIIFKKSKSGNKKKSKICKKEKAILHIDDNVKHIHDCLKHEIPSILINRPWNKKVKVNTKRINEVSLKEIESFISELNLS
ncbi:MAG TPA: hypothetical protein VHA12_00230 [Candidatus Nanoarchaeia archaeon]|nr:hypothetical protein [Candidatus Nanoarchaeia archaeon]